MKEHGKRILFQVFFSYLPVIILAYILVLYVIIRRTAVRDDAQQADIIVVFGAAQYNGRPSPVFRARLDHAAMLYRKNYASKIMTTGGYGMDPRYSEANVGKNYLMKLSIPADCIFTESNGQTTFESIDRCLEFMKLQKLSKVIAVSDGFHLFRIKRMFLDHQVIAFGSPAQNSPIESNFRSRVWASLREVFVYTAYLAHHQLNLPIPAEQLG